MIERVVGRYKHSRIEISGISKHITITFKIVFTVENNKVVVTIPPNFSEKKQVTVHVDESG